MIRPIVVVATTIGPVISLLFFNTVLYLPKEKELAMQNQPRLSTLQLRIISILILLLALVLFFYLARFGKTLANPIFIPLCIVDVLGAVTGGILYNKTFKYNKK